MKHLRIRTENDVRLANEIYHKLTENTTAMVFLRVPETNSFYVFGYNANWLLSILEDEVVGDVFPYFTLDDKPYYKLSVSVLQYLLFKLTDRDIEIRII